MDLTAAAHAYNRAKHEHAAGWEERCLLAAAPHLQFAPAQKIADVEEEIAVQKDWRIIVSGPRRVDAVIRTVGRLTEVLAELKRGMKGNQ